MCILVYKPAGVKLPAKNLVKNCYDNNPDGCGMMWVEDGKVKIDKDLYDFETFYSKLLEHEDKNLVFHCRIKTHGAISKDNCHPFRITDEFALAHNGILNVQCYEGMTDSESFGIDYMGHLTKEDLYNPKFQKILNEIVVANASKVAVMTTDDKVILFNEGGFIQDNGVYFSNNTFRYCYSYYNMQDYQTKKRLKEGTQIVAGKETEPETKTYVLPEKEENEAWLDYIKRAYKDFLANAITYYDDYDDYSDYGYGYYYNGKWYDNY